jgi:acetyl esterase/lipase
VHLASRHLVHARSSGEFFVPIGLMFRLSIEIRERAWEREQGLHADRSSGFREVLQPRSAWRLLDAARSRHRRRMRDRRKPLLPERPSETAYGPVKGTEEGSVRIWYGIPYAKAPEGDLRWQAPEEPEGWSEVLDCTSPADPAIQFSNNEVTGTEDCLNLDIYAADGAQKQPVLVYVHGGNNQTGTSQEIPGVDLVTNDGCVYVSLSYRLGLFGFMCLPAFGQDTGNFAMLDIAAALDWIRSNIEAFGGDPGNVTVSGFSAGGRDVMAMLASPPLCRQVRQGHRLFGRNDDRRNRAVAEEGGPGACSACRGGWQGSDRRGGLPMAPHR